MTTLLHRKAASASTSCSTCCAQGNCKRTTVLLFGLLADEYKWIVVMQVMYFVVICCRCLNVQDLVLTAICWDWSVIFKIMCQLDFFLGVSLHEHVTGL